MSDIRKDPSDSSGVSEEFLQSIYRSGASQEFIERLRTGGKARRSYIYEILSSGLPAKVGIAAALSSGVLLAQPGVVAIGVAAAGIATAVTAVFARKQDENIDVPPVEPNRAQDID